MRDKFAGSGFLGEEDEGLAAEAGNGEHGNDRPGRHAPDDARLDQLLVAQQAANGPEP